jgi:hypothetical protein
VLVDQVVLNRRGQPVLVLPLVEAPPPPAGSAVSPVVVEILKILKDAGKALTAILILVEMVRRKMPWSEQAVRRQLDALAREGTLLFKPPPRRLPAPAEQGLTAPPGAPGLRRTSPA